MKNFEESVGRLCFLPRTDFGHRFAAAPCYLKKFDFTTGQIDLLRMAGQSDLRKRYSR